MKNESRSTTLLSFLRSQLMSHLCVVIVLSFSLGCNNLSSKVSKKLASLTAVGSGVEYDNGGSSAFILDTVLPSQSASGVFYDMLGTESQFDQFCPTKESCKCQFVFTQTNVGSQTLISPVTYNESDLLRCANVVPTGIGSFDVSIITTDLKFTSNTITVNLSGGTFSGSAVYLDLTSPDSFIPVKRFQCRRMETIPNFMDGSIIDPFQSEDPRIIYPFNYFTTNVGDSLLELQKTGTQQWDCSLASTKDYSLHAWSNPMVFSVGSCGISDPFCVGDGEVMYPRATLSSGNIPVNYVANTGRLRASFLVSKQMYGPFQVPLAAAIAPSGTSLTTHTYSSLTKGYLGYAAKPIPSGTSSSCPNITLPANSRWVKLWNYRATDITAPKYVSDVPSNAHSAIACNPGNNMVPSCEYAFAAPVCLGDGLYAPATFGCPLSHSFSTALQATAGSLTRVLLMEGEGASSCYQVDTASIIASNSGEKWLGSAYAFQELDPPPSLSIIKGFPWNVYADPGVGLVSAIPIVLPTGRVTGLVAETPSDPFPTLKSFSEDPYTDNLFVVTSVSVDDTAMKNQDASVAQYRPITYRSKSDCSGVSRAGCPQNQEIHWEINMGEIGNPANSDVFPLCVLQRYE